MRYNKLHQALALRADRIVASTAHYARQHHSRYGPAVRAIPWGADTRVSPSAGARRSRGELNVLFVGQMRPYKGVETLLAAAAGQAWLNLTLVETGQNSPDTGTSRNGCPSPAPGWGSCWRPSAAATPGCTGSRSCRNWMSRGRSGRSRRMPIR